MIGGGGVAALEAMIALRDLLNGFVDIALVAPGEDFVYRPLSVAEPFGLAVPRRFPLRQIAVDHNAQLRTGLLESVNYDQSLVTVRGAPRWSSMRSSSQLGHGRASGCRARSISPVPKM